MVALDNAPDEDLLARIAGGDLDAMGAFFRRRQQSVFRFALHLTGSSAVADDVTQDVFLTVIRDASRFETGRGSVTAWLCGIARNFVRRRLADEREATSIDEGSFEQPIVHTDPLGDLTQAEALDALRRAVLSLPLRYREALVLCDLQEMAYAEAAEALGCPVGTVRSRLHRARSLLVEKMQAEKNHDRTTAA